MKSRKGCVMERKDKRVYKVRDNNPDWDFIVFDSNEGLLRYLEYVLENGVGVTDMNCHNFMTIDVVEMTQEELDNLPEYD